MKSRVAEPELVDVAEAGRTLGVSVATVWRMIRSGRLTSVRKQGRRLIPRVALQARVLERQAEQVPPFRRDHPIFRLAGAGRSGGEAPGARDKHAILDR